MRLRQLVLACGFSSFVLSQYASALGLGEVKLNSTLNEPLNAEVKLLDTRDLTADQILVALASPADFERNNVDRLYFYTEFQFEVVLTAPDGPKVLITSRNPVREPYLNFLIEARWTAGRLLREYTILMDLPTFEQDSPSVSVQPARVGSAPSGDRVATTAPTTSRAPSRASTAPSTSTQSAPTRSSAPKASSAASISGDQYEVRSNDTLWEIALRARADSSVSVHQAMMALYEANPEAFINGNIHMLRRGQVLRVPSSDEMKTTSRSEAITQFAQASGDSSMGAQLSASRRSTSTRAESTEVSGRVKLAAPSSGSAGAGLGSGANDGAGKALEAELAATLEELDKSKAENTELSSRVKDLEAQINTMQRLVDVSNEKLRSLQVAANQQTAAEAEAAKASVKETVAPVVDSITEPAIETQSSVADTAMTAVAESAATAESSAAAASSAPAVQPKKIIPPPVPQPTMVDTLIGSAPWIGLGVLGLAGAGYFFYRRRKQNELEQAESQDDIFAMDPVDDIQDQYVEEPQDQAKPEESFEFEEEEAPAIAETGDVVGEADIYIAYGKLDQAEEMLLNGLQKDPNSVDIRMKLLEVYAQQQNLSGFDKHYSALLPLAGGAVLARAAELREHIDGAGEFAADVADDEGLLPHEESSLDDFGLDDFQLDDDEPLVSGVSDVSNDSSSSYDLDLSDEFASLASSPTDTVIRNKPSSYDAESELDLDLSALDAADDEFSLDLDDSDLDLTAVADDADVAGIDDVDDLSELSLALDDLDADVLPEDVTTAAPAVEEEFSFDFNDDQVDLEAVPDVEAEADLDVAADDFNLDLDAGGVDLAALDHEMESLDVDFDEDDAAFAKSAATVAEPSFDVDTDNDFAELDSAFEADDLGQASIDLADDNAILELDEGDDLSLDEMELGLGDLEEETTDLADATAELESVAAETEIQDDDVFAEALSDFSNDSAELNVNDFSSDASDLSADDMDAELDFLADADEAATKLDLARAYIDMGDTEGARDILAEVVHEGNEEQRKDAAELLGRIDV